MTNTLTREQFIETVNTAFHGMEQSGKVTLDIGGYYIRITGGNQEPGRYAVTVIGPTGLRRSRGDVSPYGIAQAAGILYGEATEIKFDTGRRRTLYHGEPDSIERDRTDDEMNEDNRRYDEI